MAGSTIVLAGEWDVTIDIINTRTGESLAQSSNLDHLYYRASSIFIGNSL